MSDPVTNVEIEDVLSSIRRLVSADTQPDRDHDGASTDAEVTDAHANFTAPKRAEPKLVLTPAQRVNDAEAAPAEVETAFEPEQAAEPEPEPESMAPVDAEEMEDTQEAEEASLDLHDEDAADDEIAEVETLEAEPEASEAIEDAETIEPAFEADDAQDHEASQDETEEDEASEPDLSMADTMAADDDLSFDEMSEPDVPEFLRRPITQMNPPEDAEVLEETSQAEQEAEQQTADQHNAPETLTSKFETLEAAVAHQPDEWEPDGGDAESLSAAEVEPLPWHDIEAETADLGEEPVEAAQQTEFSKPDTKEPTPQEDTAGAEADDPTSGWFGEDALIDEDALRDMVGEIVRQELQGALGERITRNVRKLVRREIHRALMSKGLD